MATSDQINKTNYYLYNSDLSPEIRSILSNNFDVYNANPEDLVSRYKSVYNISPSQSDLSDLIRGLYGNQDSLNQYAYDAFRNTLGRDPTANEFAQALPYFGGTEGRQRGAAYLATLAEQYKQSPEYINSQAPNYYNQFNDIAGNVLGRDATQSERDYYGRALSGGASAYEIEQALKNSPEYLARQDQEFRSGLASELEGYDTSFFNRAKQNVLSNASRKGGGVSTSSALDFALTNLIGDIAERRGQYLAGLSSSQYGGNKDSARADYLRSQDQYLSDQEYEKRRRDAELDYYRGRSDQDRDYMRQRDDYMNYLNSQKNNRNPYGQLAGGLIGAAIGGYTGGPQGAMAGYNIGSGVGGGYDYLNS